MTDKMTDNETLQACCKLMASIFARQAKSINATNTKYEVKGIKDFGGNSYGNIEVEWRK